jgi:outer membrane protein insertion porin family
MVTAGSAADIDRYVGQRIARVSFVSDDPIEPTQLERVVTVAAGQTFDSGSIRRSIQALYETREYSYIEVDAENLADGLAITFRLRPNFFFADFRLGGDPVLRSPLSRLTSLPLGETYSPKVVQDVLAKVQQALKNSGYYQAEVISNIQFLSQRRLATVEFLVLAGDRAAISDIALTGSPLLEEKEILDKMKSNVGGFFDNESLKRDLERLRKLYSERGFLNATIRLEDLSYSKENNSVKLKLRIDAGSFVYIEVTGAKISKKELRSLVPIYEEGSVDQDLIEEGKRNIEDYFERRGFFDVSVEHELIEVPADNAYQINYTVDRGKKQKVVSIEFAGAKYFNKNQLLTPLKTKAGGFTSKGKFSRDLMDQDVDILKDMYLRAGFEKVEVQSSSEKDESGSNIAVTFTVKEGPQTHVTEVVMQGNQTISREELLKGLNLSPGQPFSTVLLDEDRRIVESKYSDRGFVDVTVETTAERLTEEKVRVLYKVSEGKAMKVDDIHIVGNRLTKNKIIGRNIDFHEGDPLSQDRILTSQQKLYSLGLFNRVDIVPINVNPIDSYKPVIIRVEDGSPIILGYGGGFQDREGPRGTVEISHNNLFGLARSISFRTRASFREQRGQITYKEPRLFNHDLDSFVTLLAEKTRRTSFNTTRTNASLQVLKRSRRLDNFFFRYNFETVDLSDIRVNPLATGQENLGTLKLSSFSTAWLRDTRDDPFDPTKGFFNTANFSVTSKLIGSQANFVSFFGQTQSHRKIGDNMVLASSLRLGLTKPYGSTLAVPISERFFAGGSTTLRGFNLDCAGPLDIQDKTPENESQASRINCGGPSSSQYYAPLGGNALFIANFELRIPITNNIAFVPFYDAGNVFGRISAFKLSSFANTLGAGFRYKTPFGPLRIDLGFNLSSPVGMPNRQLFITIGNPF